MQEFGKLIKSHFLLTYYQDVKFRQRIEKQLSTIELSNKFGRVVFFANGQVFQQGELESMQMATACQTLIQNSITLWNYLYLSDYLLRADEEERAQTIQRMKRSSMLSWGHVNLQGEYDFRRVSANQAEFNIRELLKLKVAS